MSKLASLLGGMTLNDLAKEVLSLQGRRGDTELAHVNKREAALLKSQGGSGTINTNTGMPEFYDGYDVDPFGGFPGGDVSTPDMQYVSQDYQQIPTVDVTQAPFQEQYGQSIFGGQPSPSYGGGETFTTPQEISGFRVAPQAAPQASGYPFQQFETPGAETMRGMFPVTGGVGGAPSVTPVEQTMAEAQIPPEAQEPGIMDRLRAFEEWAKKNPQLARGLGAAVGGLPGMMASRKARKDAEQTRAEMERMAAPIRAAGEEQLAAGRRGELTASQQQQIQAARAAAKQDLTRRGVTSGTAAQMAENRITELAQRFAQTNIDNGVRLIGAANSYNAQAIQMAYKMNSDANAMTNSYFTNLMRAFGALPTEETVITRTSR